MSTDAVGCVDVALCALACQVVLALRHSGLSVVTAESCTGGMIAALLSHGESASDCLHGGFVAYTKAQKTAALGVSAELLRDRSAVHPMVAREMVIGALARSAANLAISTTGVLGPDPDEDGNPAGLVYLGIGHREREPEVIKLVRSGEPPDRVRRAALVEALWLLQQQARAHSTLLDQGVHD